MTLQEHVQNWLDEQTNESLAIDGYHVCSSEMPVRRYVSPLSNLLDVNTDSGTSH